MSPHARVGSFFWGGFMDYAQRENMQYDVLLLYISLIIIAF